MQISNHRQTSLIGQDIDISHSLDRDIDCEYLVVGGGMTGMMATLRLIERGANPQKIAIIEKGICGSGMSGRSGGFLTPDSEMGLRAIESRYGSDIARKIWSFGSGGQTYIHDTAQKYNIQCDLRKQNSLLLGIGSSGQKSCEEEHRDRLAYDLNSTYIAHQDLNKYISASEYNSAVMYDDCFGINARQYLQGLKKILLQKGVQVYENTHISKVFHNHAKTTYHTIKFGKVIMAVGNITSDLDSQKSKLLYGVKNFITISEPLNTYQIQDMLPSGELMCRDTKIVFSYYRIVDGSRIILGGGNPISAFLPWDIDYELAISLALKDFRRRFSHLKDIVFDQYRSGRIQVTPDLMPIVDVCPSCDDHIWIMGCPGLPWASACARYAVDCIYGDRDPILDQIFAIDRKFVPIYMPDSKILKSFSFAISHLMTINGLPKETMKNLV